MADASNESKRSFGDIEFDHVSFSYSPERQVLKDISLRIKPGQVAAFVGATGSGKSTIANLIPRFYEINEGTIRVDGKDVRDLNLESLRENISFVLQDTVLFHGPIWQNIAYGKLDATREEIIHAAQLANCHEFIRKMPEGYDTIVGERGVTLSGGQRQRIAIARAIIRNSPILILDEATAGLDAASEQVVMDALTNLMRGRTCLINAHRLSTIRHADVIFVLQEGKIVDSGTHNELISREGIYAMLHRIQFRRTEFEELVGYGTPLPSPEELDRPLELAAHA